MWEHMLKEPKRGKNAWTHVYHREKFRDHFRREKSESPASTSGRRYGDRLKGPSGRYLEKKEKSTNRVPKPTRGKEVNFEPGSCAKRVLSNIWLKPDAQRAESFCSESAPAGRKGGLRTMQMTGKNYHLAQKKNNSTHSEQNLGSSCGSPSRNAS